MLIIRGDIAYDRGRQPLKLEEPFIQRIIKMYCRSRNAKNLLTPRSVSFLVFKKLFCDVSKRRCEVGFAVGIC